MHSGKMFPAVICQTEGASKSSTPNVQITKLNLAPYLETLMGLQSQKYAAAGTHPAVARKSSWKSENTRPLK